jgi:hypothetical protein
MHAFVEQMLSLESEDSEDDGTRVDGREGVTGRDEEDVTDTVGARSIVAAKGYDGTQGQAVGVEDLKADNKYSKTQQFKLKLLVHYSQCQSEYK